MTHLNDREYNSQDTREEPNGKVPVRVTRTSEREVPVETPRRPLHNNIAYRNGYVQGRTSEQHLRSEDLRVRDNDNAARGLMVGVILTSLAGLVIGTIFVLAQRNQAPTPATAPIAVPNVAPAQPQVRERVIERDRVVPAPQQPAPSTNTVIGVPSSGSQAPAAPSQSGTQSGSATSTDTGSGSASGTTNSTGSTAAPSNNGSTSGSSTTTSNSGTSGTTGQ